MSLKVKYDVQDLQIIAHFEKMTKSRLKDYLVFNEKAFFIVEKGGLQKALGPDKKHVTKLEELLKKKIKMIEYTADESRFIKNVFSPLKVVKLEKDNENVVTITGPDQKTKGLMIGAKAQNLRMYEQIIQKYYPEVKEIKIV